MNKQFKDINSDIKDDIELLNLMLVDTKKFKDIYLPGPYWKKNTICCKRNLQVWS